MRSLPDIKTVFVLSGGANPGAVQVGMLYAMLESGIHPYQAGRSGDWQKLKCTASQELFRGPSVGFLFRNRGSAAVSTATPSRARKRAVPVADAQPGLSDPMAGR